MKRILKVSTFLFALLYSVTSFSFDYENHKGFYLYVMEGFMTAKHDQNVDTGLNFGSNYVPGLGLTLGYNITDYLAPELQINYSTVIDDTPSGSAREHIATARLNLKYSFLTNIDFNQREGWKIYPFLKAGGLGHGLFVNAPSDNDSIGAYGYGFDVTAGVEFNYKAFYMGLEFINDFVFLQDDFETIATVRTQIIDGGFSYQPSVMLGFGFHL